MNTINYTSKRESIDDDTIKKILECSAFYGLDWYKVPAGILINNGTEYWLIKLKKGNVRKLYHQNHGRSGKSLSLPCDVVDVNNAIIQRYFHSQPWDYIDIKKAFAYIYNHGNTRRALDSMRQTFLQTAFA